MRQLIQGGFQIPNPFDLNSTIQFFQYFCNNSNLTPSGALPRRRNPRYVVIDRRLVAARTDFQDQRARIIGGGMGQILNIIQQYLRHIRYLLG